MQNHKKKLYSLKIWFKLREKEKESEWNEGKDTN